MLIALYSRGIYKLQRVKTAQVYRTHEDSTGQHRTGQGQRTGTVHIGAGAGADAVRCITVRYR